MSAVAGALFDLDGTLVDTTPDLVQSANAMRRHYGLAPQDPARVIAGVGRGVESLLAAVLSDAPHIKPSDALAFFNAHYLEHCADTSQAYPGISALLDELAMLGVRCGVVTNKPQAAAEHMVAKLDLDLPLVLGAQPGRPLKPDPTMLRTALQALPVPSRQVVYIGDMEIDLTCARAADCAFIGVDFGFAPGAELATRTVLCVDNPQALRTALVDRS